MENITEQYRSLLPGDVHIAVGDIGQAYAVELLSSYELEEYRKFKHQRRKDEFLSTRGLIKELAVELGLDEAIFEIQKDDLGKPFGVYNSNTQFNLSLAHTGDKVVCGISPTLPLGVDIEPANRNVAERLRNRILHPDERLELVDEPIIRIWTLKEALVKLEGKGLRTNLNRLKLRVENDHCFTGVFDNEKTARICSFQYCNHWIAVAYYIQL